MRKKNPYALARASREAPRGNPMFKLDIERMTDYYPVPGGMNKALSPGMLDDLFLLDDRKFQKGAADSRETEWRRLEQKELMQHVRELESGDTDDLSGEVPGSGARSLNPQQLPPGYFRRK